MQRWKHAADWKPQPGKGWYTYWFECLNKSCRTQQVMPPGAKRDLHEIPAEIVADQAVKLLKADQLFTTGRELEMACYHVSLPPFDGLSVATRSMLGALLDYAHVERKRFARAWRANDTNASGHLLAADLAKETKAQDDLFGDQ
jgi:hypothetical protein